MQHFGQRFPRALKSLHLKHEQTRWGSDINIDVQWASEKELDSKNSVTVWLKYKPSRGLLIALYSTVYLSSRSFAQAA